MLNVRVINRLPKADKIIKNIRYGTAVGLTKLAKEGQAASVGAIKGSFTTRGNWYQASNKFGVRIKSATPAKLQSQVHTAADWLEPHERGGDKRARGGGRLAVAVDARPNKAARIPSRFTIRALKNNKNVFKLKTAKGDIIVQRVTRGKNKGLRVLYGLEPRVKVKKRSTFHEPIEKVVKRRGRLVINREINQALRTMR